MSSKPPKANMSRRTASPVAASIVGVNPAKTDVSTAARPNRMNTANGASLLTVNRFTVHEP